MFVEKGEVSHRDVRFISGHEDSSGFAKVMLDGIVMPRSLITGVGWCVWTEAPVEVNGDVVEPRAMVGIFLNRCCVVFDRDGGGAEEPPVFFYNIHGEELLSSDCIRQHWA